MRSGILLFTCGLILSGSSAALLAYEMSSPETLSDEKPLTSCTKAIVTLDDTAQYRVELAQTPSQRSTGLMWRKELEPGNGMLFVYPEPDQLSFWMKNTFIPLDIIFIAPDGRSILNIEKDAQPESTARIISRGTASGVLEVGAMDLPDDIEAGDKVSIRCVLQSAELK